MLAEGSGEWHGPSPGPPLILSSWAQQSSSPGQSAHCSFPEHQGRERELTLLPGAD